MPSYNVENDYYVILEILDDAIEADIKTAYRKQARIHHPDKGGDAEKFKLLVNAYEVLIDPEKRAIYDRERGEHYQNMPDATDAPTKTNIPEPLKASTLVFNQSKKIHPSTSQEITTHSPIHETASAGIKISETTVADIILLASTHEYVALALLTEHDQLNRIDTLHLWKLACQYPSVAWQMFLNPDTRKYLYKNKSFYSSLFIDVLTQNYMLLVFIASSPTLTQEWFDHHFTGTMLKEIYEAHLSTRGSCEALVLILESNPHLHALFLNHQEVGASNTFTLSQLELLDVTELKNLALKHVDVAKMTLSHPTLTNKAQSLCFDLIDVVLTYPDELIPVFFQKKPVWKLQGSQIVEGCQQNHLFLERVLQTESYKTRLNGYDVNTLIQCSSAVKETLYQDVLLRTRHACYLALTVYLTTPNNEQQVLSETKLPSFMNEFGTFNDNVLHEVVSSLSREYEHQIIAANMLRICHPRPLSVFLLAKISPDFFNAIYAQETLRPSCYKDADYFCGEHIEHFLLLMKNPIARSYVSPEQIYALQQKWVKRHKKEVSDLFSQNLELKEQWKKGYEIAQLVESEGVSIANFEPQAFVLSDETEHLRQIHLILIALQEALIFQNVTLDHHASSFILWLSEQTVLLNLIAKHPSHPRLLPGLFWFLVLMERPVMLDENLHLDAIQTALQSMLSSLQEAATFQAHWIIRDQDDRMLSTSEQEHAWFETLFAEIDVDLWMTLAKETDFQKKCSEQLDSCRYQYKLYETILVDSKFYPYLKVLDLAPDTDGSITWAKLMDGYDKTSARIQQNNVEKELHEAFLKIQHLIMKHSRSLSDSEKINHKISASLDKLIKKVVDVKVSFGETTTELNKVSEGMKNIENAALELDRAAQGLSGGLNSLLHKSMIQSSVKASFFLGGCIGFLGLIVSAFGNRQAQNKNSLFLGGALLVTSGLCIRHGLFKWQSISKEPNQHSSTPTCT